MPIELSTSLTVGQTDTPLDARTRVAALTDLPNIENPFLGMIIFCIADGKHYKVTGLKAKEIGALTVPDAQIDTYALAGGDGVRIDMAGPLSEKHLYDDADRGFCYLDTDSNEIYIKLSDDFEDWSVPAPGGIQGEKGEKGDTGDKGDKGDQGDRGENSEIVPDLEFVAGDIFGGSLIIDGTKTIAQIEIYDATGNGQTVKAGDPDSPVMITTEWANLRTVIYFGQSDVSNGGRIRFAQGISGQSLYQMWLADGHVGTEADYLAWLKVQGARHDFTQDDLENNSLTIGELINVVAVADNDGSQWQLPQNTVTYSDNSTVIDLSGIMAIKNITEIVDTWQLVLAGGDKGDKGDQGEPGAVTFEELTPEQVETLTGDSAYEVWLNEGNAGTEADFIASLKGDKGDQGIQGIQGVKGDDGDSAYQVWLDEGNTGSEADFLAAIKGDKGDQGDQGEKYVSSDRYEKGNISGAVTIDYALGDYQVCTATATISGFTFSNLPANAGMVLCIDNSAAVSITFGSTEIIATSDTGVYLCAFFNDNSTVYFVGKNRRYN